MNYIMSLLKTDEDNTFRIINIKTFKVQNIKLNFENIKYILSYGGGFYIARNRGRNTDIASFKSTLWAYGVNSLDELLKERDRNNEKDAFSCFFTEFDEEKFMKLILNHCYKYISQEYDVYFLNKKFYKEHKNERNC